MRDEKCAEPPQESMQLTRTGAPWPTVADFGLGQKQKMLLASDNTEILQRRFGYLGIHTRPV